MRAFFAGKMSVDDAPTIRALIDEGVVAPPRYVPEWWRKRDRLAAQVTHSVTLNRFSVAAGKEFYGRNGSPPVASARSEARAQSD